jgi:hypothetical protein
VAHATAARACAQLESICAAKLPHGSLSDVFSIRAVVAVIAVLFLALRHLYSRSRAWSAGTDGGAYLPRITDSWDVAVLAVAVAAAAYLLGFMGVPAVLAVTRTRELDAVLAAELDTGVPTSVKLGRKAYVAEDADGDAKAPVSRGASGASGASSDGGSDDADSAAGLAAVADMAGGAAAASSLVDSGDTGVRARRGVRRTD